MADVIKEGLLNREARGPLEGVLVLDLSRWVAGPYCSNMLSDMGATVIKVEPLHGDQARYQLGSITTFHVYNHGKKSIAVDLETKEGNDIILRLARVSDVVLENYRPGKADELGVGYEALSNVNPQIVYCSISAFGETPGHWRGRPGVDPIIQGVGGIMSVTGMPGGPPLLVGVPVADMNGAVYAYAAIATALYHRSITGHGQHVRVAIVDTLVFMLSTRFAEFVDTGEAPQPLGNAHSFVAPYQAFATSDGWITVAVINNRSWRALCQVVGLPHLADDPRYATVGDRRKNRESLAIELQRVFQTRSSIEWMERLDVEGVLCGPIWNVKELIESDLVADHGLVVNVQHPVEGEYPVLRTPFTFSETPGQVQGPAPMLGEHTREVLRALGYRDEEVARLRDASIIGLSI